MNLKITSRKKQVNLTKIHIRIQEMIKFDKDVP